MIKSKFIFASLFFLFIFGGCANKVAPTGGPKDETPPELINAVPEDNTVNFNSNRIELNFDEYIQLKELNKQLVISPPVFPKPDIVVKKRSVIIEFKEPLQESTTYTINFGNAIADIHEDNPVNGFRYVFSTGDQLDSLNISGEVVDAQTLKPVENAMVLLYKQNTNDSLFLNSVPDYFTRTNASGSFIVENLKEDKYFFFAISEQNNNYIFDSNDERVGFIPTSITAGDKTKILIKLFNQFPEDLKIIESKQPAAGKLITIFNKPATNISWSFIDGAPDKLRVVKSKNEDTITFLGINHELRSYEAAWFYSETPFDTVNYQLPRSVKLNKDQKLTAQFLSAPSNGGILKPGSNIELQWDLPIQKIDSTKIQVYKDSIPIDFSLAFTDSIKTTISIKHNFESGNYILKIPPGAVTDLSGLQNDSINISYSVPLQNSKGSISYKINVSDDDNYFLQLVNADDEVIQQTYSQLSSGIFIMLDPGNYFLRLIKDENNNLQWDRGDFKIWKLPEEVIYYKTPVTVRANWEVEIEWNDVNN